MKKLLVFSAMAVLAAGPALAAGSDACCSKDQVTKAKNETSCVSLATLNLNAEQKAKLESWQGDCMKAGCTKQSRAKFLEQAKSVLTAEQYATLKKECDSSARAKTS
jgi:hypothetical protein